MVDEEGNLTGVIDWDNAQTVPRFLGFSSFPGWITRDWDPIMYHYPANKERENSPEELKRYHQRYSSKMREMLHGKGDSRFVNKSHIFEAVSIAACDDVCRLEIVRKIVARVSRIDDDDALEVIRDMGSGMLTPKENDQLRNDFQALLSVPRHQGRTLFSFLPAGMDGGNIDGDYRRYEGASRMGRHNGLHKVELGACKVLVPFPFTLGFDG